MADRIGIKDAHQTLSDFASDIVKDWLRGADAGTQEVQTERPRDSALQAGKWAGTVSVHHPRESATVHVVRSWAAEEILQSVAAEMARGKGVPSVERSPDARKKISTFTIKLPPEGGAWLQKHASDMLERIPSHTLKYLQAKAQDAFVKQAVRDDRSPG
jgi:hypothetical protein